MIFGIWTLPLVKVKATRRMLLLVHINIYRCINSPHLSTVKSLHEHLQNWGQNNYSLHRSVTGKYFITTINPLEHHKKANFLVRIE